MRTIDCRWPLWRRYRAGAVAAIGAAALMFLAGGTAGASTLAGAAAAVPCSAAALGQAIDTAADNATLVLAAGCTYSLTSALPAINP